MNKIIILILFLISCDTNKNIAYKNVNLNRTQKIQVEEYWKSQYTLSYLWSSIEGPKNHNSSKIINGNTMLFTPGMIGEYVITVSIQNSMGNILGEEKFHYNVVSNNEYITEPQSNTINNGSEAYTNNKDSIINIDKEEQNNGYTIQIASWDNFEDAVKDRDYLRTNGFNAYIAESLVNKKEWYRVRVGENLSYNKCLKLINELMDITNDEIWIDKF